MTSNHTGRDASDSECARIEDLVRKAQEGESAAFEELVKAFSANMYNLAYRMTANQEDAADLTQEIFVKLHRAIGKFSWRSSFKTWLYTLAVNTCRSGLRRLRRVWRAEVVRLDAGYDADDNRERRDPPDTGPGPSENAERAEIMRSIEASIAQLDEEFRMVIVLRDLQNLSYEDIAEATGCTMGTVKSRLARARTRVKDALLKEGLTCSVMK